MTDAALNEGGETNASLWVRRTAAVTFFLLLTGVLSFVYTRVIAARVPEQRATLERLIAQHTGLTVRFDNVHFAWGLDGTSAVFTHVELTEPERERLRVVAPELRVEFDTWDFLRHQRFSLGHVTISSPDIDIFEAAPGSPPAVVKGTSRESVAAVATDDEAALLRRAAGWAELMPAGRIEVEGARVHVRRRGERAPRHNFTLSQAVVSRDGGGFNAFGTVLLAQDVGQSLFVSIKLTGLAADAVAGEARLIARRVLLDRLALPDVKGRGTVDANFSFADGRIVRGRWQASARDLKLRAGARFDHLAVGGRLERDRGDVLLTFTDLQVTRGARLERTPSMSARLRLEPGTLRVARTTVQAERVPFLAAEFIAGMLAPQLADALPASASMWKATAGELRELSFDSGERISQPDGWRFSATVAGLAIAREQDRARIQPLAGRVAFDARHLQVRFEPEHEAQLRFGVMDEPRPLTLQGTMTLAGGANAGEWHVDDLVARSGTATLAASGAWGKATTRARPLEVTLAEVDRALLYDAWRLWSAGTAVPASLVDVANVQIVSGKLKLVPERDAAGHWRLDRQRSSGEVSLAGLATQGAELPRLSGARGTLGFSRGATRLALERGQLDDMALTRARLDWARDGAPLLRASLRGPLESPLLRRALASQGLERLRGTVQIDAEARGERELRTPDLWRVTARVSEATLPLSEELPPVEKLSGTIRYASRELRSLELSGQWLDGPVEFEARRAARGAWIVALQGTTEAAPLLRLANQTDAATRVKGALSWSGSAQRLAGKGEWQLTLASGLNGVESSLPSPFDKPRARMVPVKAELSIGEEGLRNFTVDGRNVLVRAQLRQQSLSAHFEVHGIVGDLRRKLDAGAATEVEIDRLTLARGTAVLAAAAALPQGGDVSLTIGDLRYAGRSLGALHASMRKREGGVEFDFESPAASLHRLSANGNCPAAEQGCRADFTADTTHLATLLRGVDLPDEWPTEALHMFGELQWRAADNIAEAVRGSFELEARGAHPDHQLVAQASVADGQVQLMNIQGTGPAPDQVFRGNARVGLEDGEYVVTLDYERLSLATAAVPRPAIARLARAWTELRGSAARRGWAEEPEAQRREWRGRWQWQEPSGPLPRE